MRAAPALPGSPQYGWLLVEGGRPETRAPHFVDELLGASPLAQGHPPLKGRRGAGLRTLVLGLLHAFSPGALWFSPEQRGM